MKEDEREILADIVQNIDEQEIFLDFIAKADTIKESWQIVKIFEGKKKEFLSSIGKYDELIKSKQEELKIIINEINDANNLLKNANNELDSIKTQLEEMRVKAQFYKTKIMQSEILESRFGDSNLQDSIDSNFAESNFTDSGFRDSKGDFLSIKEQSDSKMLDFSTLRDFKPLSSVSVHIRNGATAIARVAQVIYDEGLHESYKSALKRLYYLKDRISELKLTNKKLSVELRDLSEESNFKENMSQHLDFESLESSEDLSEETSLDERINKLDEKKEKVDEMFLQLNRFLKEDSNDKSNMNDIRDVIQSTIRSISRE